ncbi:MAG: CPBP family intramembrane metalloprotease [Clostridia bacterium]|nr:CPBP family intramembrane metalloprotease [Clostridia bacterium]MBR5423422.1 CPBP family intramembrane metalloprotease [Clostridia bacterium]
MNGQYPYGDPYGGTPQGASAPQYGGGLSRFFRAPEYRAQRTLFFTGNLLGVGFLGYLLLSTLFSIVLRRVPAVSDLYDNEPLYTYLLDILYSLTCVGMPFLAVFVLLKRTRFYHDLTVSFGRTYENSRALLLVVAGLGVCFAGSLATNYFAVYAKSVGFDFYSFEQALEPEALPEGALGVAVLLLRSAVVPAVVEECVFRGVILQSLRRFGDWFAIVCTAVMFGLTHANMTQVPFAVIAGVALGYCAVVTGSLRTGIAVHFLNNLVSVITVLVQNTGGDGVALIVSNAVIYGGIVLGGVAVAVYASKNRFFLRLRPGVCGRIRAKGRLLFLAPALLVAVLWLLWYTLNDIMAFNEWAAGLL